MSRNSSGGSSPFSSTSSIMSSWFSTSAYAPPAAQTMPTVDSETIRRARLRAMRRMVAQNQGRESTILGGSSTTLGGA